MESLGGRDVGQSLCVQRADQRDHAWRHQLVQGQVAGIVRVASCLIVAVPHMLLYLLVAPVGAD